MKIDELLFKPEGQEELRKIKGNDEGKNLIKFAYRIISREYGKCCFDS